MTDPRILVGIDGGSTKTMVVAARADGSVLGAARVLQGTDIYAVPVAAAVATWSGAIDQAIGSAIDPTRRPHDIVPVFSLAGADWPEDVALIERHVRERWSAAVVVNDAIGALRGAIPEGPGVVVVCGTGTATGARGPDGRTWHSGFWQEAQGARELGERALRTVYGAELGIEPATTLTERILESSGERDVESLLRHATGREVPGRRDPATYASILLDAADAGDPTAAAIVERHGMKLGRTAAASARRVGIGPSEPFHLALTGGVLQHPSVLLRDAITRAVVLEAPGAIIVEPSLAPAGGALLLAFDAAHLHSGPDVRNRIGVGMQAVDLSDPRAAPAPSSPGPTPD